MVMHNAREKNTYRMLSESGRVSKTDLDRIYEEAGHSDQTFSQLLIKAGLVKESDLLEIYAKQLTSRVIALSQVSPEKSLLARVPVKFATHYHFFPIKLEGKKLTLAFSKMPEMNLQDEIRLGLGFDLDIVFAPEHEIQEMIREHYGLAAGTLDKIMQHLPETHSAGHGKDQLEDIEKLAETPSLVQLVNQIIFEAYRQRASDVHFEPYRDKSRIRYRVDGVLHEQNISPEIKKFFPSILSRLKIMANLNIMERRLPQDGKARVKTQDQMVDLRISSIPTPYGESMVVRILPSKMILKMEDLGFDPENLKLFKELVSKPHGILFVTGPTGSGKSTTLYAGLNLLNKQEKKIITIEDPIEYELEGASQLQVSPEIGLTFSRGLRSMLRHDPDIMMVGEVRDFETADIAIRVALTGHFVLSTLHTNDAASGVTRLIDIGVEPYLVVSSIVAFVAQRLVRVVCPSCRVEDDDVLPEMKKKIAQELNFPETYEIKTYKGKGCKDCRQSGFQGRTTIHEILIMSDDIRQLVFAKASAEEIKKAARKQGMQTLRQDGWRKVVKGLTTVGEVLETTATDLDLTPRGAVMSVKKNSSSSAVLPEPKEVKADEQRSYPRKEVEATVDYRVMSVQNETAGLYSKSDWVYDNELEDLSASGAAFYVSEPCCPGQLVEIQINLIGERTHVRTMARIIRSGIYLAEKDKRKAYSMGVQFVAIASEDRAQLELFCGKKERLAS